MVNTICSTIKLLLIILSSQFIFICCYTNFEIEALNEHNRLRARHGSPPLKLNRKLCEYAREWGLHIANRNVVQHRPRNPRMKTGENISWRSGAGATTVNGAGARAVRNWYNEIRYFNFRNGGFSKKTGHFTQVVWKNTKEMGIAMVTRGNSSWIVCNYTPPGNVRGHFRTNVPSLLH